MTVPSSNIDLFDTNDTPDYVASIDILGLHGRYDFGIKFSRDVNILYGRNGTGKTTVLHVLANLLNGSLDRFAFLRFHSIALKTRSGRNLIPTLFD